MCPLLAGALLVPSLVPLPRQMVLGDGLFTGRPGVVFDGSFTGEQEQWLKDAAGRAMHLARGRAADKLVFRLDSSVAGPEAYRLNVKPHIIDVSASDIRGAFWALQTLRQLRQGDSIPCVSIEDSPAFVWRGVMLDEARHFLGAKFVKRFLDLMSLYKFNVLHWHLTDDQGWRIEIKSHPELTKIGAWRVESDGKRYGGFYTQSEIRDIVAYAAARNIMVVPEIEMPGHSTAAIAADPWLTCLSKQISVPTIFGVFHDVLNPGRESTYKFLDEVLSEVVQLFPAPYVHIGGDEVPKEQWRACPDCQAEMKAKGLKDEEALQAYFMARVATDLQARGRTAIGWDDILKGGAPSGALVQVWNDQALANRAIASGNSVILSPQANCYLNRQPDELPLQTVYTYDPLAGVSEPSKVLGCETTLWSEHITDRNCMAMFLPRGLAMSEIFWSNPAKDFPAFLTRLQSQLAFLDDLGIESGSPDKRLVAYSVSPDPAPGACSLDATFGVPGMSLRYSLEERGPSMFAGNHIEWPVGSTIRVEPFKDGRAMEDAVDFKTIKSLAYGARVELESPPQEPYAHAGAQGLVDGLLGTNSFRDGIWLGWQGPNLVATCDLGRVTSVREVGLHCLQEMRSWILMPRLVRFEVSVDGQAWKQLGQALNTVPDTKEGWITQWLGVKVNAPVKARYIRVTAETYGKLPAWHSGAGKDAWLFADELVVR